MRRILSIAINTFRSAIRERILYAVLGFAVLYLLFTIFLGTIALKDLPMIKSFGLAGIYFFGLIITIFLASSVIVKEMETRTLYFVLSKPVSRLEFILGKFLGLLLAVAVTTLVMLVIYLGVVAYQGGGFDWGALLATLFELLEIALIIAFSIFISSFSTSLSATIYTTIVVFVGHLLCSLLDNAKREHISGWAYSLLSFVYYVLPNLEKFNLRNLVVHNLAIPLGSLLAAAGYGLVYIALLLYVSYEIFKHKEL